MVSHQVMYEGGTILLPSHCMIVTTANLGLVFSNLFVQYSQRDLPPLRSLCGEAPGRDANPGRADLVAGTLTTRPLDHHTSQPQTTTPHLDHHTSHLFN